MAPRRALGRFGVAGGSVIVTVAAPVWPATGLSAAGFPSSVRCRILPSGWLGVLRRGEALPLARAQEQRLAVGREGDDARRTGRRSPPAGSRHRSVKSCSRAACRGPAAPAPAPGRCRRSATVRNSSGRPGDRSRSGATSFMSSSPPCPAARHFGVRRRLAACAGRDVDQPNPAALFGDHRTAGARQERQRPRRIEVGDRR